MLSTRNERLALALILGIGALSRVPLLASPAFLSDEAAYVYAAYAIGRGVIPYEEILLPHPPLGYLVIASLEFLSSGSILILRLSYAFLLSMVGALSYFLFRVLRTSNSLAFSPLIGVGIFIFYPSPYSVTTILEFIVFEIPILLGMIFLGKGLLRRSFHRVVVGGIFLGIGMMVWYPAIFVAGSLLGFLVLYELGASAKHVSARILKYGGGLTFGGLMSILAVLGVIAAWGDLRNFWLQTVTLQSGLRAEFTLDQRFVHIGFAVREFLPLIMLALVGGTVLVWHVRRLGNPLAILPLWIFASNFVLLATVPRVVLNHYFAYLTPFLAYLAAGPTEKLFRAFTRKRDLGLRPNPSDFFQSVTAISMLLLLGFSSFYAIPSANLVGESPYTAAERTVGIYVSSLTSAGERVWTSEGGIAYFAGRLIQPPESPHWPFQVIYNDIFNNSYVDFDGVEKQGLGVVSPSDFVNAWENHRTRVLVFILGEGPVPYPDEFLWFGFPGTEGVESWVTERYDLTESFSFQGVGYLYQVWQIKS